jgi:dTDP-4-dehydrorhamnose reductase
MRVVVLGHRGMLGHVVALYLVQMGCEVLTIKQRFTQHTASCFADEVARLKPDWCVNCIALGPGRDVSRTQLWEVNGLLPQICALTLPFTVGFVQPSTDGVFVATKPARSMREIPDALDDYGWSKQLAEAAAKGHNRHVIRCSIIGPERGEGRNLMNWFLRQKHSVPGYVNSSWNGITTLEWAKLCFRVIQNSPPTSDSVLQPGVWPALTKYELLSCMARIWSSSVQMIPSESPNCVARTLLPNVACPNIEQQLLDLKAWYSAACSSSV